MVMVQNFDIITDKFNAVKIYTSGNYAQKWILNFIIINS
jgi:hypothetical protein